MASAPISNKEARRRQALIEQVLRYHPGADKSLFNRLFQFIDSRASDLKTVEDGGLIPFDPLDVVSIVVRLRLDPASVMAGLLIDLVSNRLATIEEIQKAFGEDVSFVVEGVTKISMLSSRAKIEPQAEEFRKMILAMAKDVRVVLVRLALCLQQVRAMYVSKHTPPPRMPREILEIYAPIAHRLGIYWIKNELEDMAFALSQPEVFSSLQQQVAEYRKGGANVVRKVVAILKKQLRKHNISGQVLGREKHIYSIHDKLHRKGGGLEALYDMIGYRIIVRKKADCYRVLGMVHGEFSPIPGRLKDYIALPKSNGYQSLHSVVFGPFGNRIEIQIRTEKMHQVAESGVAAHWNYKEGKKLHTKKNLGATGFSWLKRMLEVHQNADDPGQFLENVKIDLFPNEIYLFSPAGDIITLPMGATPVDFAYGVHSEVGDHCQGAKVNGRIVPLKSTLATGDVVEILTNRKQTPNLDWLRFVVTSQARYRINRWEKMRSRDQSISLGRELLGREIQKTGHGISLTEKLLQRATTEFDLSNQDELLFRLGSSQLSPVVVLNRLFPEWANKGGDRLSSPKSRTTPQASKPSAPLASSGLRLEGWLAEMSVMAARCCNPVPGDAIVGVVTTGKGITLHARECPNMEGLKKEPERLIDPVDWPTNPNQNYSARLRVWANNRRETLTRISHSVISSRAGIIKVQIQERHRDPFLVVLELEVADLKGLQQVMQDLRVMVDVVGVERIRG